MGDGDLVGRERELGLLEAALDEAAAGRGAAVCLSGEPGVGKTATARALAAISAQRGATVLWGTCFEGTSQPPYGAWFDALAPLGAGSALEATGELAAPEARLRLFTSVLASLMTAASHAPTVVVLDDLHWAGSDSLELFAHVAARAERARLLLVGTYRDPDPALEGGSALGQLLAGLVRLPWHLRIHLRGLDTADVGHYLRRAFGDDVPGVIVQSVRDHTGGNPFYVRAVATALVEEGKLVRRDGRWLSDFSVAELRIPGTVRDAVRGRLARLPEPTRGLLHAASLFAGNLDLETVRDVADLGEDEAMDAVDDALATGFLQTTGSASTPYAFPHAIVRHVLADSLNPDRAARLHRRAAGVLERRRPDDHAAIGEQYWLSRSLPGAEQGLTHCVAAADDATEQHAYGQAIRLLEFALEMAPEAGPDRVAILERLAVAQAEALDYERAPATTLLVVDGVPADQGAELIVRVAEALRQGAPASSYEPLVARGLALTADRRDALWARLATMLEPVESVGTGVLRVGRWIGYPAEAVAALRSTGLEDDEARAIEPFLPRSEDETLAFLDRSTHWTNPRARLRALDLAGRDFSLRHGRPLAALECYRELLDLGERVGSLPATAEACAQLALCLALVGDLPESEEQLGRAGVLVRDLWPGHRLHMLGTLSSSSIVGYFLGTADWEELAGRLSRWLRNPAAARAPFAVVFVALGALCHALAGAADEAGALLAELDGVLHRLEPQDHAVAGSLWFGAAAAWELQDGGAAARLSPLVDRHLAVGGPAGPAPLHHAAGRLAALRGDRDEAAARFAEAQTAAGRSGHRSVHALATYEAAQLHDDRDAAAVASRSFERLGMRGWRVRAEAAAAAEQEGHPAGLTPREVEVLRLLAAGLTSHEIAERLVVSVATVNRHVANIYVKIDVRNRAEATSFAISRGLVGP